MPLMPKIFRICEYIGLPTYCLCSLAVSAWLEPQLNPGCLVWIWLATCCWIATYWQVWLILCFPLITSILWWNLTGIQLEYYQQFFFLWISSLPITKYIQIKILISHNLWLAPPLYEILLVFKHSRGPLMKTVVGWTSLGWRKSIRKRQPVMEDNLWKPQLQDHPSHPKTPTSNSPYTTLHHQHK